MTTFYVCENECVAPDAVVYCVCVCVRACVRACARVRARLFVWECYKYSLQDQHTRELITN